MKLYPSQINELFKKIKNNSLKGLLLYGPDKGYISEIYQSVVKEFDLLPTMFDYPNFNVRELKVILNSRNFFLKRELVKISCLPSPFNHEIKELLKTDFLNLLVIIGDEVPASSELRKYFETENQLASIACYHDDEQSVVRLVLKNLQNVKKTVTNEALDFLKNNLKGDHGLIVNEINKLLKFVDNRSEITLEDVTKVVSPEGLYSLDELCIYFVLMELEKFLNEYTKLKLHNINEVVMIRSLIKYYLNLYIVLSKVDQGQELGTAVKSLTPPIFFKYAASFTAATKKTRLEEVLKIILVLQNAEVQYKINPHNFDPNLQLYMKAHPKG